MRQKRKAQFLMDVATAARKSPRMPRGRPSPLNLTGEGRKKGLQAMREAPLCRFQRRNGEQCRNAAMRGSSRCLKHGGRVEVPRIPTTSGGSFPAIWPAARKRASITHAAGRPGIG